MKKQKSYWDMNTEELAQATKEFDDHNYHPPAVKHNARQLAQQRRWRQRAIAARATLSLSLDQKLIEQIDEYAANHRKSFSEVVSDAVKQLIRKKSA